MNSDLSPAVTPSIGRAAAWFAAAVSLLALSLLPTLNRGDVTDGLVAPPPDVVARPIDHSFPIDHSLIDWKAIPVEPDPSALSIADYGG